MQTVWMTLGEFDKLEDAVEAQDCVSLSTLGVAAKTNKPANQYRCGAGGPARRRAAASCSSMCADSAVLTEVAAPV